MMRRKHVASVTLLLLVGLVASTALWLRIQRRQYVLNRQLITALEKNRFKQALVLVKEGADPNTHYIPPLDPSIKHLWDQLLHHSSLRVNHSPTAFMIACGAPWNDDDSTIKAQQNGLDNPQLTQTMLAHGAKVNAMDDDGWTPLMCAVRFNRPNTVGVLLVQGANVNAKDRVLGWTPLFNAINSRVSLIIVRLLLQHGADVNAIDSEGRTPLTCALYHRVSSRMICLLLEYRAPVNVQDGQGITPLIYAVDSHRPDLVRLLLEHGANVNTKNDQGATALYWAVRYVVDKHMLLFTASAMPDRRYLSGMAKDIVRQLLAHRADPNATGLDRRTPLYYAQHYKCPDIAVLLKHAGARK